MTQGATVYRIETLTVSPFFENTYLVIHNETHRTVLIDPGDEPAVIQRFVEDNDLSVEVILLTHAHMDHIGGVTQLKETWPSVKVALHPADLELYHMLPQQPTWLGLSGTYPEPPEPDIELEDGQDLVYAGLTFTVIHTPGHTPGSCCFRLGDNLFTGDTLFQGSIGRTDLPGGSYTEIIRSIMTRILPLGDSIVLYPGHGPTSTIGRERLTNPFLQIPYVPL